MKIVNFYQHTVICCWDSNEKFEILYPMRYNSQLAKQATVKMLLRFYIYNFQANGVFLVLLLIRESMYKKKLHIFLEYIWSPSTIANSFEH